MWIKISFDLKETFSLVKITFKEVLFNPHFNFILQESFVSFFPYGSQYSTVNIIELFVSGQLSTSKGIIET